ncbi:LppA family lipoprotein [Mycoplasma mycoides]|uniref:LppA family lipoprotein n=1 Tax=Mycoplasma mycoides TaxID=2102 RepID=UPI00223F9C1B|nr:LppA family lipoprotein [Mycoplasma mycoides]QVK05367.1 LppA family lipoprotein [Mycoplasma mycoides subsp. capri]
MRKFNKLFLTILPISSISAFSVVSCTTSTKNNNQIPTIPNNTKPENQKQPEQPSDKKPDSESDNHKQPDDKPSPGKPENKPDNSHNPKEPENNNSNNDQPQGDQPQDNKMPDSNVDFSDLKIIKREISLDRFYKYSQMTALSAWIDLRTTPNVFKNIIFKDYPFITNKYNIKFESLIDVIEDNQKGLISNVKIRFTKDGKFEILEFTLTGFKKEHKVDNKNNKENYIKQKEKIDEKLLGLYPSLLAYMLLYTEESGINRYDRDIKQSGNVINFDHLVNNNQDLFDYNFAGFSVGTKDLLLDYNTKDGKLYKDKITEARFDDLQGTLGLKIEISNRDDNHSSESTITKEFNFKGFRKVDIKNYKNNPFTFTLSPRDLNTILKNEKIQSSFKKVGIDLYKTQIFEFGGIPSDNNIWETLIFKHLLVDLTDEEHHTYKSSKTLKVDPSGSNKEYQSILGLKSYMSLYPFNTIITNESIKNILITIDKGKFILEFELHIPVYSTSFSNLLSHAGSDKTLLVKVSQTTQIDQ